MTASNGSCSELLQVSSPMRKRSTINANVLAVTQRWHEEDGLPADVPLKEFLRGIAHHLSK
jgi:hypothetical protein